MYILSPSPSADNPTLVQNKYEASDTAHDRRDNLPDQDQLREKKRATSGGLDRFDLFTHGCHVACWARLGLLIIERL